MKVVLGGGISGLAAAFYMRRRFPNEIIQVYESSNRVGGWIKSRKLQNGAIFEQGPRTLRPSGPAGYNTLELIDKLNLSDNILPIKSSDPVARNRMIYVNGELHTLPSSIPDLFKKKAPFTKSLFWYILHDIQAVKRVGVIDEPIYDFVERRFGKEIADYAISPLICGICAGDAKQISVKFLMKNMFEKEQLYGSVLMGSVYDLLTNRSNKKVITKPNNSLVNLALKEKWSAYSLRGGLQTLVNQLVTSLSTNSVNVLKNRTCEKLEFFETYVLVKVNGNVQYLPNHAVSCLPAKKLAKLVEEQHPILATYLREIPTVNVAVINLYYNKKLPLQQAFGFLVPPMENLPVLGVIYDSCCFPLAEGTVLTVMMGGQWFEKYFGDSPKEQYLLNTATQHLHNILGISVPPDLYNVNILKNCIPQYTVGHEERVANIEDYISRKKLPLTICGSSYYGVGVNDVIYNARLAVDKIQ